MSPNRTPGTIVQYRRRAEQIRKRVIAIRGLRPDQVLPIHLVEHVLARGCVSQPEHGNLPPINGATEVLPNRLAKSTFRQYKAALLYVFEEELASTEDRYAAEFLAFAIHRLKVATQSPFARRGNKTSARKSRTISEQDFLRVITALDARVGKTQHALSVRQLAVATRLTGLRPGEWEHASVRPGATDWSAPILVVRNAKATNGRANGKTRILPLDALSSQQVEALHDWVQTVDAVQQGLLSSDGNAISFSAWMHCLRTDWGRVVRKVFPTRTRYPALYTLRHQVAADAKAEGRSCAEVAALLGHGSDATAGTHYARRVSGHGPHPIHASTENVATVRKVAKSRRTRPVPL